MSKYLFLFTIGPVQSFIAQARKTQDLYAGSKLLSDLIEKTIKRLKDEIEDVEIIFPHKSVKHKPNRFVAKFNTNNVEKVGKKLEKFVREEFERIAKGALESLHDWQKMKDSYENQIKDFLQVYWVALPMDEDYSQVYPKLESYLGSIKNVRMLKQLNETGRKCSLCGERNVLFYRKTSSGKIPVYTQEHAIKLKDEYRLNPGEGLCAVCFTKRFYKKEKFPSTAEIAAMDWLQRIYNEDKNEYKKLFNNFDEQLYYEENLRKEYLKKYDHFKDEQSLDDAKKQLKELYRINDIGKPSKYYVLLMLDGDNMGRWLSGEFLEDKEKKNLKDFHEKTSKEMGKYANEVSNIIQEPKGKLVYAGGDDVLAFVNLKYLIDVITNLRKEFPRFEELDFAVKDNRKSSASTGIVIAHYKTPLSEALKWTRRMEKEAKKEGGRNAFAIAVLRHSGEISETMWKWDLDDNRGSKKIELLGGLVKELQDDENGFSYTFIKNLNEEFMKLDEVEDKWVKAELKRLLERACQVKEKEVKKGKVKNWQDRLHNLYIASDKDNFLSFLNIADFLARRIR